MSSQTNQDAAEPNRKPLKPPRLTGTASNRTVRTDGPYGPSVRTVRTDGLYGPSVWTARTDGFVFYFVFARRGRPSCLCFVLFWRIGSVFKFAGSALRRFNLQNLTIVYTLNARKKKYPVQMIMDANCVFRLIDSCQIGPTESWRYATLLQLTATRFGLKGHFFRSDTS